VKFKMGYATVGFSDKANPDEGHTWQVYFGLTERTPPKRQV